MVHMELQDERDDDRCYNKNEVKTKEDEMSGDSDDERRSSRRDWCQGDDDKITLGVWFYSIRQIVALHRIEISKWRDLSTQLLRGHDVIHNDEWFWPLSDSSLIENVISVFNEALEYRVGRKGRYAQGRYGDAGDGQGPHEAKTSARQSPMSRFASYDLIVTEREHAIVHIVNLYRVKINGALRLEFGNVYEEWELAEDEKKIPEDVIF
ncbi:hypothetical protein N0V95_007349 [Ascochyta clinopodiicola]|nr:hypothetical protein N0V95_007349 [Ascochyta clinopodiicola]